jgi:putative FmdB family regulatory protein
LAVAREESVPTYQYACTECGGQIEAIQKFSDDPLTVHEACGGKLRKVFSPVGIVFKGSGFYRTDSRGTDRNNGAGSATPASGTAASSDAGSASSPSSPESGSSSGGDKPAPAASGSAAKSESAAKSGSSVKSGSAAKTSEKVA